MNSWLLAKKAEIEAVKVEVAGMVALNQYRIDRNETIAYDDVAFQERADMLWNISEEIMKNR